MNDIDRLCVNSLRFLAIDAVESAKSGHPGLPLGAAPMAYVVWDRFLRHNPRNPSWINRDRFVLSAGHGSALLYALLHVYGYDLSLEELKRFRKWRSKTPGHPEYGLTPGVEATTGPLGQGFAMGIGMAIAEKHLRSCFNTSESRVIDHYVYSIVSDGDLMEGISSEAASLAGTLHLDKIIYLYDNNHISIEGNTDITFTENVSQRFSSYDWCVFQVEDGNDLFEIEQAVKSAQSQKKKPSLIIIGSHIGYGSPKQDDASAHGEPLGKEAVVETKKNLGWPLEPAFYVPDEANRHFQKAIEKGIRLESKWQTKLAEYKIKEPKLAKIFEQVIHGILPEKWSNSIPSFDPKTGLMATRNASGVVLNAINETLHSVGYSPIIGGSADLSPSTKTILNGRGDFGFQNCAQNIHFGVREHAMGAIANGIALHSNLIPYTATFLVFSDYMRPSIRLAALMRTHVVFVFTHDSIGLGEDGPTHQPVEQLMSLRAIPGVTVIRPADANETAMAWKIALERRGPIILVFTRQNLPILDSEVYPVMSGFLRGAYVLSESESQPPDIILIATGSEVHLALDSREELKKKGIQARVVSMPSWELFQEQDSEYRMQVLPLEIPKLAIEAGVELGWRTYVGDKGGVIGLNRFGASAPYGSVYKELGFNIDTVVGHCLGLLKEHNK